MAKYLDESGAKIIADEIKKAKSAADAAQQSADEKYLKPETGITKDDLDENVKLSLEKADSAVQSSDLSDVATSGSYNDLSDTPEEATTEKSGLMSKQDKQDLNTLLALLKNDDPDSVVNTIAELLKVFENYPEGTNIAELLSKKYEKPLEGIPLSDLADAIKESLSKADSALQSFTESDPTVPEWAKSSEKPKYDYSEIGNTPNLSDVATSGDYEDLTNTPNLSDVATSGDYEDLINKPDIPKEVTDVVHYTEQTLSEEQKKQARDNIGAGTSNFDGNYNSLTEKPELAKVATSGNYEDLTGKPDIPKEVTDVVHYTEQSLSEDQKQQARNNIGAGTSNFDGNYDSLSGKPSLADVATSGSYNDLSDVPTEATTEEAGLMSAQDKKDLNTLLALLKDDDEDSVVNTIAELLKIFETYPEGTNIADLLAKKYEKPSDGIPLTDLAEVIKDSLAKADSALQSFTESDPTVPDWAKTPNKPTYDYSEIGNTPKLSDVATSGNYEDLIGKPDIPKEVTDVVHYTEQTLDDGQKKQARDNIGAGTSNFDGNYSSLSGTPELAEVATSGSYNDLSDKPIIPTVPEAMSEEEVRALFN